MFTLTYLKSTAWKILEDQNCIRTNTKDPEPFQDKRVLVIGIFYAKCFFLLKSVFFIASFILYKSLQNVTLMCIKYVEIGI